MIAVKFDNRAFMKEMNNIIDYSYGFLEGVQSGKKAFLNNLGPSIQEMAENFIDTMAKIDKASLHHVYEWYQTGSPDARLFEINYRINNNGLVFSSTFKQSNTIKDGSREPFYDKASIMELGRPVTIEPKNSDVLAFDVDGETVFTRDRVTVNNPGGDVEGQFAKAFDTFFSRYFSQAFLKSSGLYDYFSNPVVYKQNLKKGKALGKSYGNAVGYNWVANAKVIR
jgi:hypothetical protein